jgi:hypothetical protein
MQYCIAVMERCIMPPWRFLDYTTDGSVNPVVEWCENHLTIAERAEFDVVVDYLERIEDWDEVKKAKRKYRELDRGLAGLTELKFSTTTQNLGKNFKKQFRPLGILKRKEREFIFLGGFQKGHGGPIPPDAYTKALRYKQEYVRNRGTTDGH